MEHVHRQWDSHYKRFYYWGFYLPERLQSYPDYFTGPRMVNDSNPREKYLPSEPYIGINDDDGRMIFAGDKVRIEYEGDSSEHIVKYFGDEGYPAFDLDPQVECESNGISHYKAVGSIKVIGSIHQGGNDERARIQAV